MIQPLCTATFHLVQHFTYSTAVKLIARISEDGELRNLNRKKISNNLRTIFNYKASTKYWKIYVHNRLEIYYCDL